MTTVDHAAAQAALIEARRRLVHQLEELGATESGELRSDLDFGEGFADAAAATAERSEVLGLVETLKEQLAAVDAALARIESGQYGTCVECGNPIDPARLEFRPESILCVSCKQKT
jgi:RNA polymerase-binding transcription factor DksA